MLSFLLYCAGNAFSATQPAFISGNIPELLGWVPLPACENICCGYYKDPLAPFATLTLPPLQTTQVEITANQSQIQHQGPSQLSGNIKISQPGRLITASEASVNRDLATQQYSSVELAKNVTLREPGKLIVAENAHVELQSKVWKLCHALYHLVLGGSDPFASCSLTGPSPPPCSPQGRSLDAWGFAEYVERKECGIIELKNASYTTCAPVSGTWLLSAQKIDLNSDTGRGYAYNTRLDVKGIPVFYSPYLTFPIDHRRQTGFLFPSMGHSSRSGYNFTLPFYWNIAPNYDAVFTPTYYTERGLQAAGLFRYLSPSSSGHMEGAILPHDSAFAHFQQQAKENFALNPALPSLLNSSDDRRFFSWQDITTFNPHWSGMVDYNAVSDDYYMEDFNPISLTVPNQLPREAAINYADDVWTFTGKIQAYQTLHPVDLATVTNPYQRLPELDLNADLPNQIFGLHYQLNNQVVYFQRARNPQEKTDPMSGPRLNIQPIISLPLVGMAGYFTPMLQLEGTFYNVKNQVKGYDSDIQRFVPIFNIDSGLYFDRYITLFNTNYQQTLEPRIFYLYVPLRNQNSIPLYDTSLVPFSYDSLFLTNRFSGIDRIGDANQITLGFTTRLLNEDTGAEKFHASIGEIYYFRNRKVSICGGPGSPAAVSSGMLCEDSAFLLGATSPTQRVSPIAGQLAYNLTPNWSATSDAVWDPHTKQTVTADFFMQYKPEQNHILNFGYNFVRYGEPLVPTITNAADINQQRQAKKPDNLSQVTFSFSWPILERWKTVGGINYDITRNQPQSYIYGLQYDSCCWAARFVAGRSLVGLNQNNTPIFNNAIYIQWQFKGLGNVGTGDPGNLLINNIPGYQDTFNNFNLLQ